MSHATVEVTQLGTVWIDSAADGQNVAYALPAGCVLTRDHVTVNTASPFTHSGARATYRIDCVTYTSPVTATMTIT